MTELTFRPGVMFFPVTAFTAQDEVDTARTAAHIRSGVDAGAAAVSTPGALGHLRRDHRPAALPAN